MLRTRVIASLLIRDCGLVKTVKFKDGNYIGDPINAVRIFSEKEADELTILDISATRRGVIDFQLLERISREAFMPMAYGGGIRTLDDIRRILAMGYEKVVLNHSARSRPDFITEAANVCGSQSVVVCIDAKKDLFGRQRVYDHLTGKVTKQLIEDWAHDAARRGAGEIVLYDVNRDGTYNGYDTDLIAKVSRAVDVPVVALGGAASPDDFREAIGAGHASAVAAGSIFVYQGPHRAVLITYPAKSKLKQILD
jgi:cyclase